MTFPNRKGDLQIRMMAIPEADAPEIIRDGGFQSLVVTRYLGCSPRSYVLQDELDWLEKVRTDEGLCVWGIYVREVEAQQADWQLVGTTSVRDVPGKPLKTSVSGVVLFRTEWWNRGIISASHRMRTMFCIDWRADVCIRSMVLAPNQFSSRAIEGVGYVFTHCDMNEEFRDGEFVDAYNYRLINPIEWAWNSWWYKRQIPDKDLQARKRTLEALDWARANVNYE